MSTLRPLAVAIVAAIACHSTRSAPAPQAPAERPSAEAPSSAAADSVAKPQTPTAPPGLHPASALAGVYPDRRPFDGADLSPKPPVKPLSPREEQALFQLQPGYRFGDRLLRPAKVVVGKHAPRYH